MKRLSIALLAGAAVMAAAAPSLAQPGYGMGYPQRGYNQGYDRYNQGMGGDYDRRLDRLERRIDRGSERGDLTRREAFRLRSDVREVRILASRYGRDGMSRWERADLDRRLDYLESRVRYERRDGDDRGDWDRRDRRGY